MVGEKVGRNTLDKPLKYNAQVQSDPEFVIYKMRNRNTINCKTPPKTRPLTKR